MTAPLLSVRSISVAFRQNRETSPAVYRVTVKTGERDAFDPRKSFK